jgi:DNA-binding XRE family transcriptional regulator
MPPREELVAGFRRTTRMVYTATIVAISLIRNYSCCFRTPDTGHDGYVAKPIGADITRSSDTPRKLFGMAITELRKRRDESQATVAPRVGCEEYYLRNIEQGKENLSFDVMYAIVDYFDMLPLSKFWHFAETFAQTQR